MADKIDPVVSEYFSGLGKKGGPAAAKARWKGVSKKAKSEAMRAVVAKRWKKVKK